MNYSDFQNQPSSEKITLAILSAAKRLMGWELHSGSVYKLTGFTFKVIKSLKESGVSYEAVEDIGDLDESKYFLDRANDTLYLQADGSVNPNSLFIVVTINLYLATASITLPHDLDAGFDVYWEPLIKTTSQYGVEIDTINQASEAIEGSGNLTLVNDQDFWPANFDKLVFENKSAKIYSYFRGLDAQEAKIIFSGYVNTRTYSASTIQFTLKDELTILKTPLSLGTIADLGARTGDDLAQARQRMVLGRVFGHRPVNIDQVLDGYPLTGTVSITFGSATLTGSSTLFLTQLSPDDRVILDGVEYTIASVSSNTSATLTENYTVPAGLSGESITVLPEEPKRWMNRVWHIAGHPLREPETTIANGSSISTLFVDDGEDFYAEDWIYVGTLGSGELVQIDSTRGNGILVLRQSLLTIPPIGTVVRRPAVQNVRIDDVPLVYYRDYTLDADTATLTLRDTAESEASPIRSLTSNLAFTNTSRTVTGTGLKNIIKPGYMVGVSGNAVFFEVLSVDSDTQLTLRSAATFTTTTTGRYKPLIFDPDNSVLSLDTLGRTEDGETDGVLLKTGPSIVKGLLSDLDLADILENESFDSSEPIATMHLGVVFPAEFADSDTPTYREMINAVNKSVFGALVQNADFKLAYFVLEPRKPITAKRFDESDILSIRLDASGDKLVKTCIVDYRKKEYDYLTGKASTQTKQKTSDVANYVVGTTFEKTFDTYLVDESDAKIVADRWSFILESGAGKIQLTTKMQASDLSVGDVIKVSHRKIFERFGSVSQMRLLLVESVKQNGFGVEIQAVDLSNAFNRCAAWNDYTDEYSTASEDDKLFGGYWTDEFGLIDNEPISFGSNLYW